jgi:hypothetical protein
MGCEGVFRVQLALVNMAINHPVYKRRAVHRLGGWYTDANKQTNSMV